MNPIKQIILTLLYLIFATPLAHAEQQQAHIGMNLPQSIIKEAIEKTLPLSFKIDSDTLLGSLSIDRIENLQLKKNIISSRISISGHELDLVTNIAGHDLRVKIGSLSVSFQCDTTIRFDRKSQTIYLRPTVTEVQPGNSGKADIASALILLFDNQEIPLRLEKLQPILADTGSKTLTVSMHIAAIQVLPKSLQLYITPRIGVNKTKKAAVTSR